MDRNLKKTIKLNFKQQNVDSLIKLSNQLPTWRKEALQSVYGNLLSLLEVKVQTEALTALAQFFDPEHRCFTFQDYQLAPTLEEFEKILGFPAANCKPYSYVENYSLTEVLAGYLNIKEEVLAKNVVVSGQRQGFMREYLEAEADTLLVKKDWKAFSDALAVLIYGIVLFPSVENFVDSAAIDVFLAFKKRKQNPAHAILADVYYSLFERHSKKGGIVWCCLPALYRWFVSHVFNSHIEERSKDEWKQLIAGLKGNDILWCSLARDVSDFVYQLDGFPNVPLIGTRGCINYNPALALRQLGYPMISPPPAESLVALVLHQKGVEDLSLLRKIARAWDRPVRKGRAELGRRSTHVGEGYLQWIQLRVQIVKLPFQSVPRVEIEIPEPAPIPNEEVEELRVSLARSEQEKAELQAQLKGLLLEKKALEQENEAKDKCIAEYKEKILAGDQKLSSVRNGLKSATEEIKVRNQDRDKAIDKAYVWKKQLSTSQIAEKHLQEQLREARIQLERLNAEYEEKLRIEKQAREAVRERLEAYQTALQGEMRKTSEMEGLIGCQKKLQERVDAEHAYLKEEYMRLNDHCHLLQEKFSVLVRVCNNAIIGLPRRLKRADIVMDGHNTPPEVIEFVNYVKELIVWLKTKTGWPSNFKKRKHTPWMDGGEDDV